MSIVFRSRIRCSIAILITAATFPTHAAEEVTDRPAAEFFLQDGRVIVAPGQVIEKGSVLIRRGRIVAVGADLMPPPTAEIIPCAGLMIIPGFLDAANTALLDPDVKLPIVEARPVDVARQPLISVPADDHRGLTPQFQSTTALRASGNELEQLRQAGFGAVHLTPTGRIASGQTSMILLAGRPVREAQLPATALSVFRLYERRSGDYPSTLMGVHAHLRQHFFDTARWLQQKQLHRDGVPGVDRPESDPVWEALAKVQQGEQTTLFEVASPDDFERALRFADELKLKLALWGDGPPQRSLDVLKQRAVPVIVNVDFGDAPKTDPPKADPNKADDEYAEVGDPQSVRDWKKQRWQERVRVLGVYEKAGVPFAISTSGLKNPNDLFKALREAIKEGLSRDGALAALTTRPAGILGVDRDLGRIEAGLIANVVVMTGPLDHDQTKVRFNFIEGRKFEFNRDSKPVPAEAPPAVAPLNVAGTWHLQIEAGDMPSQATLELAQNGARISGRMTSAQGDGLVTSGEATKDAAKWEVSIGTGDRSLVLKFDATRNGDALSGTVKSAFGAPAKWTAKKAAPPATASAGTVQLGGIDSSDEPQPVSALQPMASAIATVEFPEDRTARKLKTGGNVLVKNATVITITGPTLEKHSILIRGGKIVAIGPDLMPDEGMTVIDATGQFVMPGIIDTHSHIMMSSGLGGVNEATHSIVCEVRVNDIINTADPQEYRALAGGVTTLRLLHGSANVIGGQDAVVQLKIGESAEAHRWPGGSSGVKFALGENVKFRSGRFPNTRLGVEATLQRAFMEALEYRKDWQEYDRAVKQAGGKLATLLPPRHDLRLEALAQILNQEKFIHSHCYRSDEILMLLRVAELHGIRVRSLQHVLEGYKVAPEIVAHGASCSTFADWWAYKVEAYDATPYNAALLREAGANIVLKSDDAELMRHMYHEAQKPVRYGNFPAELALQMVTINPAKELGISDVVGSIEVGKQADLAIFSGHPLNTFARCEMTLIAGEPYFIRRDQPSAMTAAAGQRSATPVPLTLPPADQRKPLVNWSAIHGPRFALVGATIHPVDRASIARGTVVVENGKIAAVAEGEDIPEGCPVIRVDGLQIYPGLIDAGTTVGLTEIGKVVETHDTNEAGAFQPDLRAGVAINPDSELIPVARAGGITTALIMPLGGVICGQNSVMQTAGWTAPEMVLVDSAGMHLNWPGVRDQRDTFEQLRQWIAAAKRYDTVRDGAKDGVISDVPIDPRYEALRPYVRGEKPFHIEADSVQHMTEVLQFAEKEKLKIVLCNAADAWKMTDALKKSQTPVIIGPVMRKPLHDHDPFDAPYANASRLHDAGVKFAIRSNNPSNSRNAPFEAGMAVAYGLPEDAGLRSVTLAAAEILGIADQCGSLTVGKRADLVILDGSPLQITSQVKGVVVGGRPHAPESRQTKLYEKYRGRLKEVRAAK